MHSGVFKDKPKDREFALPVIHVYGFTRARDPESDFHERIRIALQEAEVDVEMRLDLENGCCVHHLDFPMSAAYASGSNLNLCIHFYFQIYDI
ncbi:hypothetical protein POPTR_001G408950v4 [Populus trichocarpa]|uniref:Uncharacterized protein n=1 Tax=Populus trichocarpa TaxID=3694 RepID=A0A3N7EEX6_POPTR|nr:hypothetical protein POPTR_001G408950v4 [Populus trichocarpa]